MIVYNISGVNIFLSSKKINAAEKSKKVQSQSYLEFYKKKKKYIAIGKNIFIQKHLLLAFIHYFYNHCYETLVKTQKFVFNFIG